MSNNEIKTFISLSGINQYEVANKLGITEFYLCRLFRQELSEKWKEKIVSAIKEILTQKRNEIEEILDRIENNNN